MTLYHGGMTEISTPRIIIPADGHTNDFGYGFYTTTDYGQATKWVNVRRNRGAVLSLFENAFFDVETAISELKTYNLVNQVLFHTEAAIKELKFIRSDKV
jgi:hypothetical protein